jgi:hypothetical protein
MTIRSDLRDKVSHLGHGTTTGKATLSTLPLQRSVQWSKRPDHNAAHATTAEYLVRFDQAVRLKSVHLIPSAALVANDTDFATITISSAAGAGGGLTAVAVCKTEPSGGHGGTGDWALGVPIDLSSATLTVTPFAEVDLAAGRVLCIAIAKAGAGVVTHFSLDIAYELNG